MKLVWKTSHLTGYSRENCAHSLFLERADWREQKEEERERERQRKTDVKCSHVRRVASHL